MRFFSEAVARREKSRKFVEAQPREASGWKPSILWFFWGGEDSCCSLKGIVTADRDRHRDWLGARSA